MATRNVMLQLLIVALAGDPGVLGCGRAVAPPVTRARAPPTAASTPRTAAHRLTPPRPPFPLAAGSASAARNLKGIGKGLGAAGYGGYGGYAYAPVYGQAGELLSSLLNFAATFEFKSQPWRFAAGGEFAACSELAACLQVYQPPQ